MGELRNNMLELPHFPVLGAAAIMPRDLVGHPVIEEIAVVARNRITL